MENTALTELLAMIRDTDIKVSIERTKDKKKFRFTFKKNGWEGYLTVPVSDLGYMDEKEFDDSVRDKIHTQIYKFLRFIEDEEE